MNKFIKITIYYFLATVILFSFFYTIALPNKINAKPIGDKKIECVSYAPFGKNDSPFDFDNNFKVSEELIDHDLALISKDFACIRTYSVTGLEAVPKYAKKYNLSVYLGAWVSSDKNATQKELTNLIEIAKQDKSILKALIIGNEALLRKDVSAEQLISYINFVKSEFTDIPVTYADVWEFWLKNPNIATATDFITIHILPYWEDIPIPVKETPEHIQKILDEVKTVFPNKEILIGETGWPSFGRTRENAVPSLSNQAEYIRNFLDLADQNNLKYNLIEAFDQPWKRISEGAVGGYWGIFDKDRLDKNILRGDVSNYPNWFNLFVLASIILFSTAIFAKNINKLFIVISVIGAIIFTLQIDDYIQSNKNLYEYMFSIAILTTVYLIYIFSLKQENNNFQKLQSNLWLIFLTFMLINSVYMMLDGRYREFPNFVFGFGVFLYLIKTDKSQFTKYNIETISSIILFASAIYIFINEKYTNLQSDFWVLISIIFAYNLWKNSTNKNINFLKSYLLISSIFLIIALYIRFYILNGSEFISMCERNPTQLICQIRSTFGFLIHNQTFGIGALVTSITGIFFKNKTLINISIAFGIFAISLYNVSLGAIAIILSIYSIAYSHQK